MTQPTSENELYGCKTADCPNCNSVDGNGKERVWYRVVDGYAFGACFNCECMYRWSVSEKTGKDDG